MPDHAYTERELHVGHIRAVHTSTKEVRGWRSRHRALEWLAKHDDPAAWELRPDDNPAWALDPKVLPREDGLPSDGVPVYETNWGTPPGADAEQGETYDEADCDCGLTARRKFTLADVDAKRQILDDYEHRCHEAETNPALELECRLIRSVIQRLVLPYAGHPDYRAEWRP